MNSAKKRRSEAWQPSGGEHRRDQQIGPADQFTAEPARPCTQTMSGARGGPPKSA